MKVDAVRLMMAPKQMPLPRPFLESDGAQRMTFYRLPGDQAIRRVPWESWEEQTDDARHRPIQGGVGIRASVTIFGTKLSDDGEMGEDSGPGTAAPTPAVTPAATPGVSRGATPTGEPT